MIVGSHDEVAMLRKLVPELDTAPGEVVVRGWVYEVANTGSANSAWSIAVRLLSGSFGFRAATRRQTQAQCDSRGRASTRRYPR
ncbi:hypothetical protein [Burkholderia oklahomensis]|uniref:hypothetical protein n=1 Tax=Burkholderia oklahomensis TaxID=342113 RepID=UPI000AAE9873|nr:hypothetical protein [Burkholderia oklahomensis]